MNAKTKIQSTSTIEQLNRAMLKTLDELTADPASLNVAKAKTNAAGKSMASVKLQLSYHHMRGEEPNIAFMKPESKVRKIPTLRKRG